MLVSSPSFVSPDRYYLEGENTEKADICCKKQIGEDAIMK